jgi:hypothetical protein
MGNLHTIIQVKPNSLGETGAVLRIQNERVKQVREFLRPTKGTYYTTVLLGVLDRAYVAIRSEIKMSCGYDNFINHITQLAPHLEDAMFYVMDENGFLDEFEITSGRLNYERVSAGYPHTGLDLIDHLAAKSILEIPDLTFQICVKCAAELNEFVGWVQEDLAEFEIQWRGHDGESPDNRLEIRKYETLDEFTHYILVISKHNVAPTNEEFKRQINFASDLMWKLDARKCDYDDLNCHFEEFL